MTDGRRSATGRGSAHWGRAALLVLLLAGGTIALRRAGVPSLDDVPQVVAAVRQWRDVPAAPLLFIAAYALVATLGLPATPLTLAGGAIFGTALGSLYNWSGAVLGGTGAYFLARALGMETLQRLLGARAARLEAAVGDASGSFAALLRLRLLPLVPFNVLNVGAGLAGMHLPSFLSATALGIIPGTVVHTYFADALLTGVAGARSSAMLRIAVAGLLLVVLSFLPAVARRAGWIGAARS
jgi:uncharacterized membrane protein YdjX (TVP38/TMEM64 family)